MRQQTSKLYNLSIQVKNIALIELLNQTQLTRDFIDGDDGINEWDNTVVGQNYILCPGPDTTGIDAI